MFDETSRSHTDDDSTRHIHRGHRSCRSLNFSHMSHCIL